MEDLRLSPEMDEDLIPSPTSPDDLILAHPTTDEDQELPDGKDDLRQVLLNRYWYSFFQPDDTKDKTCSKAKAYCISSL